MKWIMQIMILVNVLTFAWYKINQESFTGAEKKEFPEVPTGVKTLHLLSEREPVMDVSVYARNQPRTVSICHTFGPLNNHDMVLDVLADIEELGKEGNVRTDKQKVNYAYWVYSESMPVEELEKAIQVLEANGIKDYHRNDRNELSLGIYKGINHAKRRQVNIAALGFSPLVGPLYRMETRYWVDVTDMHYRFHTDDAWESYVALYPDNQHESTRCDLIDA